MAMNKERLKQRIVARKYFKENEPRFLTYEEKEQICRLHESDPEKWPVEKLSESFPVLPATIEKILRSKWSPKSTENILRYDKAALENWKKFRAGKLAISPTLYKHLMKFKNRKITMTDRELLAKKYVLPKPEFKKPTKQLFSSIVQGYLNEQQNDMKLLSRKDDTDKISNTSNDSNEHQNLYAASTWPDDGSAVARDSRQPLLNEKKDLMLRSDYHNRLQSDSNKAAVTLYDNNNKNTREKFFTFNEFVKAELKDTSNMSPEENITLLNMYKEQVNANEEKQSTEIATASSDAIIDAEENSAVSEYEDCDSNAVTDDNLTDTRVKMWRKKIDTEGEYLKPIKIAKSVYKPGMTYRVSDCYYDDDGEFLYRVPGVRS